MCVEVIYVELLYYGVIMCTALFSLSSMQKERKKKKKTGERERKREWKKRILIHLVHVLKGKEKKLERNILRNKQFSNEMKDSRISFVFFFYQRRERKKKYRKKQKKQRGKHALSDPLAPNHRKFR